RMDERRRPGEVQAVVRDEIDIDSAEWIVWTDQLVFLVPQKIAQIDRPELTEGDDAADRLRVVASRCGVLRRNAGARGIGRRAGRHQRRLQRVTGRRHDARVESRTRRLVARLHHYVLGPAVRL